MCESAPTGSLYEFSARFLLSEVRGRVMARDIFEARRRIRTRGGFRSPVTWPLGQNRPGRDDRYRGSLAVPAGLKIASRDEGHLICTGRALGYIPGGIVIACLGLFMGGVSLLGSSFEQTRSLGFDERNWFFGILGVFVFLFGIGVVFARRSFVADRTDKLISQTYKMFPFTWRWHVPAFDATAIVLDKKDFMTSDGAAFLYVISTQTDQGEHWPVDASSDLAAQRDLADAIAKCLNLPLLDSGDKVST